jgi:hypothetical protein
MNPPTLEVKNSKIELGNASLRFVSHGLTDAGRSNELLKQALGERVIRHALRMPLYSDDPIRIASPFDAFDSAIRGPRRYAELFPGFVDGLMMATVDVGHRGTSKPCEQGSRSQNGVVGLITARSSGGEIRTAMSDSLWPSRPNIGDVLNERALQINVENLATIADGQYWLRGTKGVSKNGFVRRISTGVQGLRFRVSRGTVSVRIHIGGATRQNKGVQFV